MPSVVRLGDYSFGHCFEARPNIEASDNVFCNGIGVHRLGDHWPEHTCGTSKHDSVTSQASDNVFCNGIGVARIGDSQTCGDVAAQGSDNVFAN